MEDKFDKDFRLVNEATDVNIMRSDIALHIYSWITKAHNCLDTNADVDCVM